MTQSRHRKGSSRNPSPEGTGSAFRLRSELELLRSKVDGSAGKDYWRSLEELSESEEFARFVHREFPEHASDWNDPVGRRRFLKLMGASLALAGATACTIQPTEKIVPHVTQPEDLVPGKPVFYATAMQLSGIASGLIVESHMGRPTKVEGNPDHPSSLGAADAYAQASVLTLYDPDRSQTLTHLGEISTWPAFLGVLRSVLESQMPIGGRRLRFLTETVTSPTLATQMRELLQRYPLAKWHQYEPAGRTNVVNGARLAFGQIASPRYHFEKAMVVLSLDEDFLASHPGNLTHIRGFAESRKLREGRKEMSRLYVLESTPTNAGAKADHRLAIKAADVESYARAIAAELGVETGAAISGTVDSAWVSAVAGDLQRHRGAGIVIPGDHQPPIVHALAHAMNQALGNAGNTISMIEPIEAEPVDQIESIKELAHDITAGAVGALIVIGGNPVYTAPADLEFGELLKQVEFTAHLSLYNDETSVLCRWHIAEAHYLESWSDTRAIDGTVSIVQPLIAPLYLGKTAHEVLAAFGDRPERSSYEIVREQWINWHRAGGGAVFGPPLPNGIGGGIESARSPETGEPPTTTDFETFWRRALHSGFVPGTVARPRPVTVTGDFSSQTASSESTDASGIEVVFRPDPTIYDGRFANNGWLQELPKPLTKLTWDNAALVSPATARDFGLENENVVELRSGARMVQAAVWITPGQPDRSVTLHLGYGRDRAGRAGSGLGFNAYLLRPSEAPGFLTGVQLVKTGGKYSLACTQDHWAMEGRDPVRAGTLEEYLSDPNYVRRRAHEPDKAMSLYPEVEYTGYKWGMAIDLNSCVGCNACVVACQAENNIPVVGKEQVKAGREMQWLRVDRYYRNSPEAPEFYFQPLPCMHCEQAPCEVVCPVVATVHSAEGTNDMIYNRCVGTRYCSNNCPYKVRRFNFLLYSDFETESLKMLRNPDVTVRSRGVMEKCTYCIQRINQARIEAEKENRRIADGEIETACQATCPADAIVFGDLNDSGSRVVKLKSEARNYSLLSELNVRPRTTYLGEVRNPNHEVTANGRASHRDDARGSADER